MFADVLVALVLAAPPALNHDSLSTATDAHKDAVARFGAAVWNLRRDRLLTAAKQLEAAAKRDPDAAAPQRELVRLYSQLGRDRDAIRAARAVLKHDPKDADTAHVLARLLFDAGETAEAVVAAKLAAEAKFTPDQADKAVAVFRDLATLCEKANDPAAAEAALRKAISWLTDRRKDVIAAGGFTPKEADTTAAECLERLGRVQVKRKQFDSAATSFAAAAKLYQEKANDAASAARLDWNLSGVYQAQGDHATALRFLERFLKLKPVAPEPYVRFVSLMGDAGRDADIVPALRGYAEADDKNRPLLAVLASELAKDVGTRREADSRFASLMTETNDRKVVEVVLKSHTDTARPVEIVALLDRVFTALKDRDDGDAKKDDTPVTAAARAFAAEKARVVGDILQADPQLAKAVLKATADGVRAGTKRTQQVYYFLGQLAARHQQLELAATYFREAVQHAPPMTIGDAYIGLIDVLLIARKPAELKAVCLQALQRSPQPLATHYLNYRLAHALAELGETRAAIAAADEALRGPAASDRLAVRIGKMEVLTTLGKPDEAITLGKSLLKEFDSPTDQLSIRYALSSAYWGAKQAPEAEAELRAIIDADADSAAACNDLGYHLADASRNLDEAERLVRHAIEVDRRERKRGGKAETENAGYVDSLGWVFFRQGKLPEARAELERASQMPGGAPDAVVWDHLGDVLFRQGEKVKARAAWERAAELYETDSRGRREGRADELKRKLKRVP